MRRILHSDSQRHQRQVNENPPAVIEIVDLSNEESFNSSLSLIGNDAEQNERRVGGKRLKHEPSSEACIINPTIVPSYGLSRILGKRNWHSLKQGDCVVCIDRMKNASILLDCKHVFCYECIARWFDQRCACPLCNTKPHALVTNLAEELSYTMLPINWINSSIREVILHDVTVDNMKENTLGFIRRLMNLDDFFFCRENALLLYFLLPTVTCDNRFQYPNDPPPVKTHNIRNPYHESNLFFSKLVISLCADLSLRHSQITPVLVRRILNEYVQSSSLPSSVTREPDPRILDLFPPSVFSQILNVLRAYQHYRGCISFHEEFLGQLVFTEKRNGRVLFPHGTLGASHQAELLAQRIRELLLTRPYFSDLLCSKLRLLGGHILNSRLFLKTLLSVMLKDHRRERKNNPVAYIDLTNVSSDTVETEGDKDLVIVGVCSLAPTSSSSNNNWIDLTGFDSTIVLSDTDERDDHIDSA